MEEEEMKGKLKAKMAVGGRQERGPQQGIQQAVSERTEISLRHAVDPPPASPPAL